MGLRPTPLITDYSDFPNLIPIRIRVPRQFRSDKRGSISSKLMTAYYSIERISQLSEERCSYSPDSSERIYIYKVTLS